jgi:hypothetical protein
MQLMLDGGSYKVDANTWFFNWSRFDETMQFLLSKGFRRIYSEGLAWCDYSDPNLAVYVDVIGGDQTTPSWGKATPGTAKATKYLTAYLTALKTHLQDKGWINLFSTQILDEPRDQQNATWDTIAASVPQEIDLIETFYRVSASTGTLIQSHAGTLDKWVPSIQLYEDSVAKPFLDGRQAAGDQKWYYTYGDNSYSWLSRLIDTPVYKNRLLFWYAFANNMDGYLHWGYNWWVGDSDTTDQRIHGDPRIMYPDVAHNTVKSSIRESNQRDGIEELELFRILKARDPALAQNIVGTVITSGAIYSHNISVITAQRERLLRAAAAPPSIAVPATATPNPVTGTSTTLSVLGADDGGEANLTYTWTLTGTPPASVNFSANQTNAAKTTVATFTTPGNYNFLVTVTDAGGLSATSAVQVTVNSNYSLWAAGYGLTGTPQDTPLHDGMSNLLKYLFDINPTQPMSATDRAMLPAIALDATTSPGTPYLTLTYRQNSSAGAIVNVQTSPDLYSWTTIVPDLSEQYGLDQVTGDPIMRVGVKTNGARKLFLRLNVTTPP